MLVELVILLRNLLGILAVEQTPHGSAYCWSGEPAEASACECETCIDVNRIEASDGVAWVDLESEEVGAGCRTCKEGGGNGSDEASKTARAAQLKILVPAQVIDVSVSSWRCR